MAKIKISIRIERSKINKLKEMAICQGKKYTDLIRSKIDELVFNGIDPDVMARALKIIRELEEPFIYMKTKQGLKFSSKERKIRELLAFKLRRAFNIK